MNYLSVDLELDRTPIEFENINDSFELSIRAQHCLSNAVRYIPNRGYVQQAIETIGDLIEYNACELLRIPNCGKKTVNEIRYFLAERGLTLKGERAGLAEIKAEWERVR